MTDNNSFDMQIADALMMPDSEVMPTEQVLTLVHARRRDSTAAATVIAGSQAAVPQDHAVRDRFVGPEGSPVTRNPKTHAVPGRQESGRLLRSVGVGIAVAVLVAAVVGGSMLVFRHGGSAPTVPTFPAHHATPSPVPTAAGPTVMPKVVYTVPVGSQPPSFLGADPKRQGVWFITGTDAATSIVFVSVNPSQDRVFSLHTYYPLGVDGGIAVASDGTVWAGINMVLIHLNPTTGAVTKYRVPTPGDSAAAEAYNPPFVKGTHAITAVAVTGIDTVALAISNADQVVVFHAGRFVDRSLPTNTVPEDVAYLADGTLGVALADFNTHHRDRVVTFTPSGARSESQLVDVWNLVSTGTQFVSVTTQMVVFNAHAQLIAMVPFVPAIKPYPISISALGILPNGALMMEGWDGVLVASLSSGTTVDLRFPRVDCSGPSSISYPPGVSPPTPYPAGYLCAQKAQLVASDGAGDVWMVLGNPSEIDVLEGVGGK
ncbi:MAG: hypothetical protein WAW53_12480 [Candidatus Dormiibacterota bacterium]